ncbi:hypothetical protein [Candidatus Chloroploca sp. Khr17]|uniref:hypothetical protein n=1 Tax=Candidatus Chloroploca sp. Khr17 TaxID=2496869 RepID=UPI00101CCC6D|nr:hypothetical protein [Candidatus Chloroploca sp. Khr17]
MLAAMVIIVSCLFFLGMGLLISTNPLVVLALAMIGLIIGGLGGGLLLRGRVAQGYHWAIFVGPAASALVFVLLCGVLNMLLSDNLGLALGSLRMYSVAMLLGTAPGLLLGLVLGSSMGRGPTIASRSDGNLRTSGLIARTNASPTAGLRSSGPLLPPDPPPSPHQTVGGATPRPSLDLAERIAGERIALAQFGTVQINTLQDGTCCVTVTRPQDGTTIYMVCEPTYPQQPPSVVVERHGTSLNIGSGIFFPWDGSCRLATIVTDLYGRI